jgi:hypothetical protein
MEVICAVMLAVGFGVIIPVSGVIGGIFDLLGIASGLVFFGLLDGE